MQFRTLTSRMRIEISPLDWHLLPWWGVGERWEFTACGWLCLALIWQRGAKK
jgi:hypothetical protein